MGRDMTPAENYYFSFDIPDYINKMDAITWHVGKQIFPIISEEEKAYHKKYENLARASLALTGHMMQEKLEKWFPYLEDCIVGLTEDEVKDENVKDWFYGRLDKQFYYSQTNNDLLVEYLKQKG